MREAYLHITEEAGVDSQGQAFNLMKDVRQVQSACSTVCLHFAGVSLSSCCMHDCVLKGSCYLITCQLYALICEIQDVACAVQEPQGKRSAHQLPLRGAECDRGKAQHQRAVPDPRGCGRQALRDLLPNVHRVRGRRTLQGDTSCLLFMETL